MLLEGGVIGLGRLKVTPEGVGPIHDTDIITGALNPLSDATDIVESSLDPCDIAIVTADEVMEKSGEGGNGLTINVIWVESVRDPPEAPIASGYVPGGVLVVVVMDTVVVKLGEFVIGVLEVVPAGREPVTVNVTGCVLPLNKFTWAPQFAVLPWVTFTEEDVVKDKLKEKAIGGVP